MEQKFIYNNRSYTPEERIKLEEQINSSHYYHPYHLDMQQGKWRLAIGERGNGKTFSGLSKIIEKNYNSGFIDTGVIIRRYDVDVTYKRASKFFKNHTTPNAEVQKANGGVLNPDTGKYEGALYDSKVQELTKGEYDNIVYRSGAFYLANDSTGEVRKEEFANITTISGSTHEKSVPFPTATTVVFDEFIAPLGELYINDFEEPTLFFNLVSTIIRDRGNVEVYLFANTVSNICPYFDIFGIINPFDLEQGTITNYAYTHNGEQYHVSLEYCQSAEQRGHVKQSASMFAHGVSAEMINGGAWQLPTFPRHKHNPKDRIIFNFFIAFNKKIIRAQIIQCSETDVYIIHHQPTNLTIEQIIKRNELLYTQLELNYLKKVTHLNSNKFPITRRITQLYNDNQVSFATSEVGAIVATFYNRAHAMNFNNF